MMSQKRFTAEFKESVVLEVIERSRSIVDVAQENNVSEQSVSRWLRKYRDEHPTYDRKTPVETATPEDAELKKLRKRVRELEQEVEILGKATAFFARKNL
jgi:transposase